MSENSKTATHWLSTQLLSLTAAIEQAIRAASVTINWCHGDFLVGFQHFFASTRRAVCPMCMFRSQTAQISTNINIKGNFLMMLNIKVCIFFFLTITCWNCCSFAKFLIGLKRMEEDSCLRCIHELRSVFCVTSVLVAEESGSFLSLGSASRSSGGTDSDTRVEAVTILTSPLALPCQTTCVCVCVCVWTCQWVHSLCHASLVLHLVDARVFVLVSFSVCVRQQSCSDTPTVVNSPWGQL